MLKINSWIGIFQVSIIRVTKISAFVQMHYVQKIQWLKLMQGDFKWIRNFSYSIFNYQKENDERQTSGQYSHLNGSDHLLIVIIIKERTMK